MINDKLIKKTGKENGWIWEKYSDGTAICYGSFSKNVACTSQWGNLYSGIFGVIDFPTNLFKDIPITFARAFDGFSCWLMASGSTVTKTSTEQIACVRPTSMSQSSITISYLAIGKWK